MYELTKLEIEQDRTPLEFIQWVDEALDKYETREDIVAARSKGTDELKVLFEESYPLKVLFEQYPQVFSEEVTIKQIVGSQPFDVIVSNCKKFEFIEITLAINGEMEALRMMTLNEVGHVSASGSIGKKGKKNHGTLEVQYGEIDKDMTVLEETFLCELIETAVGKKARKHYPSKTLLLIAFDDRIKRLIDIDMADLDSYMKYIVSPMIESKFAQAILVGFSGKTLFSTYKD